MVVADKDKKTGTARCSVCGELVQVDRKNYSKLVNHGANVICKKKHCFSAVLGKV